MLKEYRWKSRLLYITTDSYNNQKYLNVKELYLDNIKRFHKSYVKMISSLDNEFAIYIIDFNGRTIKSFKRVPGACVLFDAIEKLKWPKKEFTPVNLSLYADYSGNKNSGYGYGSKQKAKDTLKKLKTEHSGDMTYQKQVVCTMMGRAKNHARQTEGMRDAIKVYEGFLKKTKKV